jgi:RimJ/RimL family protein N-acetyltransferase
VGDRGRSSGAPVRLDRIGLDRVISVYDPENIASGRVMEKQGMRPWRRTTDPARGNVLHVYELARQTWARRR